VEHIQIDESALNYPTFDSNNNINILDGNETLPYLEKMVNPITSDHTLTPVQNARADSAKKSRESMSRSRGSARSKQSGMRDKLIDYVQPNYFSNLSKQ
jgi:hypothetical protein